VTWKHSKQSSHERGYGYAWQKLRKQAMERDAYLCQPCQRKGRVTPARECDHIIPKAKGGTDALSNLQAICTLCHREKTIQEATNGAYRPKVEIGVDGWPVEIKKWGYSIPHGVRPSCAKVTLVFGPPASGKTTYVKQHASHSDMIIDLDDITETLGGKRWEDNSIVLKQAMRRRDEMIYSLADRPELNAWLIVAAPTPQEREAWLEALGSNAQAVVIEFNVDECIQRINENPLRAHAAQRQIQAVRAWT
jgi:5-methylcytosine-specific restriction protein A